MSKHYFVLALVASTAISGFAARASAESLPDAIALAYQTNPTLQSQRAQLRSLDERYVQARSGYRPTLSVGIDADFSTQESRLIPTFPREISYSNRGTLAISATQLLTSFGKTAAEVSAAEADILAGRESLRETEANILFNVIESYAAVRRDQRIVEIRIRTVAAFQRQVDQTRARLTGGDATRTDLGQAESQLASSQASLAQAEAQLQSSRGAYANVVGQNPAELAPLPDLAGLPATLDEAFSAAEADSPVLLRAVMNERSGRARVQSARSQSRPTVSATASYGYSGTAHPFDTENFLRAGEASINMSMPLVTGGLNRSLVRQAEATQASLREEIEASRRQVVQSIAQSWNQTVTAEKQLTLGQAAVNAAQISSEGSRLEYREGNRSTFEVLNEEQRLLDAQLQLAQAEYARFIGQAALLTVMGRMEAGKISADIPVYDAQKNFNKVRHRGFSPIEPVVAALDRVTGPSDRVRMPPPAPLIANTSLRTATTTRPVDQPLAKTLPVQPEKDYIGALISANDARK